MPMWNHDPEAWAAGCSNTKIKQPLREQIKQDTEHYLEQGKKIELLEPLTKEQIFRKTKIDLSMDRARYRANVIAKGKSRKC